MSLRLRPTTAAIGRKAAGVEEKAEVNEDEGCRPDFTHQLFDEERIEGFEDGAVSIRIFYTPTSLDFLVKIKTSENDASRYGTKACSARLVGIDSYLCGSVCGIAVLPQHHFPSLVVVHAHVGDTTHVE